MHLDLSPLGNRQMCCGRCSPVPRRTGASHTSSGQLANSRSTASLASTTSRTMTCGSRAAPACTSEDRPAVPPTYCSTRRPSRAPSSRRTTLSALRATCVRRCATDQPGKREGAVKAEGGRPSTLANKRRCAALQAAISCDGTGTLPTLPSKAGHVGHAAAPTRLLPGRLPTASCTTRRKGHAAHALPEVQALPVVTHHRGILVE